MNILDIIFALVVVKTIHHRLERENIVLCYEQAKWLVKILQ